ncbi:hypothetical protein, partial [Vacuolonema iberomarrocanum]|uniref:hypothetical protein n=1 Tax=Vacuolonema iberomarrocanum TaxID=3454632 RepID=UPI003F6DC41C
SQGDNTVSIGGWGNVPPKPYKPTICLRILLALENEDPTLNKYGATRPHTSISVLDAVAHRYTSGFCWMSDVTRLFLN